MIIDVITGIIHEQNGWETICGLDSSGYAKVVDTNALAGDSIFCDECFADKKIPESGKEETDRALNVTTEGDVK